MAGEPGGGYVRVLRLSSDDGEMQLAGDHLPSSSVAIRLLGSTRSFGKQRQMNVMKGLDLTVSVAAADWNHNTAKEARRLKTGFSVITRNFSRA